ncbi:hypothetical protein DE146DRAFT_753024 [Phaeosphaeria sp. MPI-PUGE-AT-0046c]|nr:hypothetical protein DE146DRAFT_753024 [Phaeosphaeria sp. MPI-PUGE-AT-0046c]
MGSFDCYCALCCGPLGLYNIKLGSSKPRALARRKKRVENQAKRLKGENVVHEDSKEWKDVEEAEDRIAREDEDAEMKDADADDGTETNNEPGNEAGSHDEPWDSDEEEVDAVDLDGIDSDDDQQDGDSEHENDNNSNASTHNPSDNYDGESGKDSEEEEVEFADDFSQASELNVPRSYDMAANCKNETDSMHSFYEKHAYDPTKIGREDVQWTDRARVLAINPEWEGEKKAYLSGRGRYSDLIGKFDFDVIGNGQDPRDTHADKHPVYQLYEPEEETVTYPMHEACYELLTKCIATHKTPRIDKDVLHAVMQQNTQDLANSLNLDYGNITGADQFWECYAGEEWTVADPATKHGVEEVVQSILPAKLFDQPAGTSLGLAHKVREDPIAMLPYDILHGVFTELSMKDTLSLVQASWHVFDSTRDPAFWRLMIRVHIRPYFWELDDFFKSATLPDTFDWKGMFQWVNTITKGEFGMSGPLMSIANRRRIWEVCQQVASMYFEKLTAGSYVEPSDEEAAAIMATARIFHKPRTLFPAPTEPRSIKTQFIRSWSDIKYRGCNFDTYWAGPYGRLVGISVDFGAGPRLFGSTEGRKGQSLRIKSGDWIKEIHLALTNLSIYHGIVDLVESRELIGRDNERTINEMKIDGMKVILTSGETKNISRFQYDRNQRTFTVLPGMHLVGLEGEIGLDGTISSFALLQAPNPAAVRSTPSTPPTVPLAQRLLWAPKASVYIFAIKKAVPIWAHPTRFHCPFSSPAPPFIQPFLHTDYLPYTTLIWAESIKGYTFLTRISTLQVADEYSTASIIGMKATTTHGRQDAGTDGPVPAQIMDTWSKVSDFASLDLWNQKKHWDEESMRHFEIDGAGGERVVEVHVTLDRKSVKLVTDCAREGVFGDGGEGKEWDIKRAGEGEVIVGLSVCFGRLGGWSESTRMWSHYGASDFGVIIAKGESEEE